MVTAAASIDPLVWRSHALDRFHPPLQPALEEGVAVVDASVAGLGGCPYAAGRVRDLRFGAVQLLAHTIYAYAHVQPIYTFTHAQARRATWRPRTWCTCSTGWASAPGWTWRGWRRPATSSATRWAARRSPRWRARSRARPPRRPSRWRDEGWLAGPWGCCVQRGKGKGSNRPWAKLCRPVFDSRPATRKQELVATHAPTTATPSQSWPGTARTDGPATADSIDGPPRVWRRMGRVGLVCTSRA